MKKFVTAVAVVALVAFAAPVFAATNPFMDVPMNHWAYDAIGQLAAHGILSGYPDGLYKGKQPTTRYEMASALARALAVVDMTKASKQDVEMLQKLVVEFHDELEALGVRVDDIEGKVNLLDSRLGGWKLSGILRMDISNESANTAPQGDGEVALSRARVQFDRWFGDPENPMHFRGIIRGDNGNGTQGFGVRSNGQAGSVLWKQFYVEMPFVWDTLLTVGRSGGNWEVPYYYGGVSVGGWDGLGSVITDRDLDKVQIDKQFGMGKVSAYVAHPRDSMMGRDTNKKTKLADSYNYSAWELFLVGQFQFNEQFGFDIGGQAFLGDDAEDTTAAATRATDGSAYKFRDMYTIFAGLRFNFNDNVAFKGVFYHQKRDVDQWLLDTATKSIVAWREPENVENDGNRWSVMLDVKQEALKFTSLWLEYGQVKKGFWMPGGVNDGHFFATTFLGGNGIEYDTKFYRIALAQTWNEKWTTHEFYYGYKLDDTPANQDDMFEWGLGVTYNYNPNVKFGLNFTQADNGAQNDNKDNIVRFRTEVTF